MKRLSHTSGRGSLCWEGCSQPLHAGDVFVHRASKHLQDPVSADWWSPAPAACLRSLRIYSQGRFTGGWGDFSLNGLFFHPCWQQRWARRESCHHSWNGTLGPSRGGTPTLRTDSGWFQTEMISALCVWRWSVISISLLSSPSTSLKEVHC